MLWLWGYGSVLAQVRQPMWNLKIVLSPSSLPLVAFCFFRFCQACRFFKPYADFFLLAFHFSLARSEKSLLDWSLPL